MVLVGWGDGGGEIALTETLRARLRRAEAGTQDEWDEHSDCDDIHEQEESPDDNNISQYGSSYIAGESRGQPGPTRGVWLRAQWPVTEELTPDAVLDHVGSMTRICLTRTLANALKP